MAKEANIEFFIGEAIEVTFTVVTGADIQLTALALSTDTSLAVEPLREALANNDVILFPDGVRVTLDSAAVIGATSISIDAITGNIENRAKGQKIQDISTWTDLAARFRHQADDTGTPPVEKLQTGGGPLTLGPGFGDAKFTLTSADTKAFKAGLHVWDVWREDTNAESALIYGSVNVLQAPSQAPT